MSVATSVIQRDTIQRIAATEGVGPDVLHASVADALAQNVELRLRQLIEVMPNFSLSLSLSLSLFSPLPHPPQKKNKNLHVSFLARASMCSAIRRLHFWANSKGCLQKQTVSLLNRKRKMYLCTGC
jgi:hypothetical protein